MEVTGQKVRKRGYSGARLELIKKAASLSLEEYTIPEIAREHWLQGALTKQTKGYRTLSQTPGRLMALYPRAVGAD